MSRGPGKWQRALLAALESRLVFYVGSRFRALLGRDLTAAEGVALRRAVRQLDRAGRVVTALLWEGGNLALAVGRPGATVNSKPLTELSVPRVPDGHSRNTYEGSLRNLAKSERVSVATIRRDLARAERKE